MDKFFSETKEIVHTTSTSISDANPESNYCTPRSSDVGAIPWYAYDVATCTYYR